MVRDNGITLGEFIAQIEQQAGTSITDRALLDHKIMLVNSEPTAHPSAVVMSDGVAGPVIYVTAPRPI